MGIYRGVEVTVPRSVTATGVERILMTLCCFGRGRLVVKLLFFCGLVAADPFWPAAHVTGFGIHDRTGANSLQAINDHSFAGAQAFGNHSQAIMHGSELHWSEDHLILFVNDVEKLLPLVSADRSFGHE